MLLWIKLSTECHICIVTSDSELEVDSEEHRRDEFHAFFNRLDNALSNLRQCCDKTPQFLIDFVTFLELVVDERLRFDFLPYTLFTEAVALTAAKIHNFSPRKLSKDSVLFFGWLIQLIYNDSIAIPYFNMNQKYYELS